MPRVYIGIVVAVALIVCVPVAASAHAVLLRGTPSDRQTLERSPEQVQLLFSEPLDQVFSSIRVIDPGGQRVDRGDGRVDANNDRLLVVSLQPGLPNGVYTVVWRNLSAIDVHPDEGQYQLFVGVPVAARRAQVSVITATPATTLGRWWFYVAASLFGGVLAAWKLVLSPALAGVAGVGDVATPRARHMASQNVSRLVVAGGVLLIVGTLFTALAQAAAAANTSLIGAFGQPLADLLLRGRFAAIWWPRIALEVASLVLVAAGGIDGVAAESALATLPAVLLTSAITSHGAALPEGALLGIAIDWLHIVGATAWVGGLIGLLVCLPIVRTRAHAPGSTIARFGRYALIASLLVLLSGALQAGLEVGSAAALVSTTYGELVLVKVGLLAAMLLLALSNEWRARRASPPGVSRGVRAELLVGVVVLGVAAMLSGTPPSPLGA